MMNITINGRNYNNISKIEIDGVYEVSPHEGPVIHLHLYNTEGKYRQTVSIRDFDDVSGIISDPMKISQEKYESICDFLDQQVITDWISMNYQKQFIDLGGLARIKEKLMEIVQK